MLHIVDWKLIVDVSGQPIGPILKGKTVVEDVAIDCQPSACVHIRCVPNDVHLKAAETTYMQ